MVKAFEQATGKKVAYKIAPRWPGDIATCYADPKKAKEELGWVAEKTLEDMCKDSWNYIQNRKWGFGDGPENPLLGFRDRLKMQKRYFLYFTRTWR